LPVIVSKFEELLDEDIAHLQSPREGNWQPEMQIEGIGSGGDYNVFPCLAAEFELHDFVLKGRAEPLPLNDSEDPNAKCISYAALVLYSTNGITEDVYEAIRMLEAAHYIVENIDSSVRMTLCRAMENVNERDLEGMKIEALGDVDPFEALDDEMDILSRPTDPNSIDALAHQLSRENTLPTKQGRDG